MASDANFIHFGDALEDPALLLDLVQRNGPYQLWIRRVFPTEEALMAVNRDHKKGDPPSPAFRADVGNGSRAVMEGAEPILFNPAFIENAKKLFGGAIVQPELVYANLNGPSPSSGKVAGAHCDTPNFRGLDKDESPYWLLHMMNHSGLFTRWQIDTATAVCWYYRGEGGEFWCWPNGTESRPIVVPPGWNTGIMADNDRMFHTAAAAGRPPFRSTKGMTIDSTISGDGEGGWVVQDEGRPVIEYGADEVRIALYWRAQVFRDERELKVCENHLDDVTVERAIEILLADMARRGVTVDPGDDAVHNQELISAMSQVYGRAPSVYETPVTHGSTN